MGISNKVIFKAWLLFSGIVLLVSFLLHRLLIQTADAATEHPSAQRMLLTVYSFSFIQFLILGVAVLKNKEKKATPKRLYLFAAVVAVVNAVLWSVFKFYIV